MAGRGSRFAQIGIATPKPLIPVRGKPMYAWATDGLPLTLARRLIFICLREHLSELGQDIAARYAEYNPIVVALDEVTQGQACTVLAAREWIDTDEPLLIFNADTYCRTTLAAALEALPPQVAGVVDVFRAPGERWSFARLDGQRRVLEMAEKRRISEWATTGLYYFRRGSEFARHADAMIADSERATGEYYVAPVYNRMIAAGAEVRANPAEAVWVLGTPEDLAHVERECPPGSE
jgi:dTDP-glucose pyrophosphorylase